ncbi:unnamed protein product [Rhizoctonia solani]|uniref:Glucose-methanol-choline oxidoreductase N-terminal domain-containing protein n=1 Tax=Rhizoctonia solani TaxID=456999 RepID=A0A8H3DSF8_9AGAM|nr:unnamed protein product [Rhizoctonia solani]
MKLLYPLSIVTSAGIVAGEVSRRGMSNDATDFSSKNFDYVVVGGGTAGLTVAARLSEDPKVTVGVIEAGEYRPDDPAINTPGVAFSIPRNATYDWLFKSIPQVNSNGRVVDFPRGKLLGGTSAINVMGFDRASKVEYDAWAKLGNTGWDWDGFLPSMKAAERFTGVDPFRVNDTSSDPNTIFPSQGKDGLVSISYNNWYDETTIPFRKSLANLGVPVNYDPDSGNAFGDYNSPRSVNSTTGRRSYSASTYYAYNAHRPNFIVLTGAQATKINFKDTGADKSGNQVATGVSFVHGSQTYTVKAKKEVILSAGTFQSPHLLELSGIGNSTILQQYGIKTLIDLPGVGENFQEHPSMTTTYELKQGVSTQGFDALRDNATFAAEAAAQYAKTHDGILSYSGVIFSFTDLDTTATSAEVASITAQLDREIASDNLTPLQKATYDIQKGYLKEKVGWTEVILNPGYLGPGTPKVGTSYISITTGAEHPFSRGSVHLTSSDPLVGPQIDPNYFSKSIDLQTLLHAVKFSQKLSKTEPLASKVVARFDPAPEVTSDADLIDYIKANVGTLHHPIGTASLAPKELGGVVDTNLKVYGTSNVRVADASIIPLHIATHIQRTVYGVAEKAAKIIKNGH